MHSLSVDDPRSSTTRPSARIVLGVRAYSKFKNSSPKSHNSQESLAEVQLLRSKVAELEKLLDWEHKRGQQLMTQLVQQSHAFDQKDATHRLEIEAIREEEFHRRTLSQLSPGEHAAKGMDAVSLLHELVQNNLSTLHQKTSFVIEEQCKGLSKQLEIKLQRKLKEKESLLLRMEEEVKRAQESEESAKRKFEECKDQWVQSEGGRRRLLKENKELEEIRVENEKVIHNLQKQLVELRNDCAKTAQDSEKAPAATSIPSPYRSLSPIRAQTQSDPSKSRSDFIISKLKRMLEHERKNVRVAKAALALELKSKTDLESFLRDCLSDLRLVIGKYRKNEGLSEAERSEILSALMSQAQVLRLLYDRTFPPKGSTNFCRMPGIQTTNVDFESSMHIDSADEL